MEEKTTYKDLSIGPGLVNDEKTLKLYLPIIEIVSRKEYKSIPSYLAEYSELVNVGLITVNKLIKEATNAKKTYNSSYIAQAVKWAIKDELRTKYNWYGIKQNHDREKEESTTTEGESEEQITIEDARERVFETILYIEDMQTEKPIEQMTPDELAKLELIELRNAVKRAVDKLPEKHKEVIQKRFYEGKRGNDVAKELGVTPSRISHMIQDAIEKVKQNLKLEGYCT